MLAGSSRVGAALLAIFGVTLALLALPSTDEEDDRPRKRPTLIVTPEAIVVRDARGMRSWHFDDLADVTPYADGETNGILVVRRDGKRDFIDTAFFERGERVGDTIGRCRQLRTALRA